MNQELIQNGEAQFNALKAAAEAVADQCNLIQITDPTTLAIAQQQLSLVKEKWNAVEAIRKTLKQPSLDEGKAVDALAKPLLEPLSEALQIGKEKILAFEKEQAKVNTKILGTSGQEQANIVLGVPIKGMREKMVFEAVNLMLAPFAWLQVNEEAIQAFYDQHKENIKDGDIISGIRFYKEKSVTIR